MKYFAEEIKNWETDHRIMGLAGWRPARPLNHDHDRWRDRIKWAWGVLIGRYDALDWQ